MIFFIKLPAIQTVMQILPYVLYKIMKTPVTLFFCLDFCVCVVKYIVELISVVFVYKPAKYFFLNT